MQRNWQFKIRIRSHNKLHNMDLENKTDGHRRRSSLSAKSMHFFIVAALLALCFALCLFFLFYKLTFWCRQNVPNEVASIFNRFQKPFHIADNESAQKYGDVVGIYEGLTPCLMIKDLDLVKKVLIEDFWNFPNHRKFYEDGQLASRSIVVLEDQKWKRMRQILSPVFSAAKLKSMEHLYAECIDNLISNFTDLTANQEEEAVADVRQYFGSFSVDLICSVVFGIKINSLKDPQNEIVQQIQHFFGKSLSLKQLLLLSFPCLMKIFDMYLLDYSVLLYLNKLTKSILTHRQEEEKSCKTNRKDFIKLLMEATGADGRGLSQEEIADQVILFLVAGYDTSAASLSSISYCLAMNQPVQQKLYHEVQQFMRNVRTASDDDDDEGESFMDEMNQLKYLDAVIKESMRFLPIVPRMERRSNKNCYLQTADRRIFVPKDAMIIIPIYSLNHDERYFVSPENFNPDRFLDPEQEKRMSSAYLAVCYWTTIVHRAAVCNDGTKGMHDPRREQV